MIERERDLKISTGKIIVVKEVDGYLMGVPLQVVANRNQRRYYGCITILRGTRNLSFVLRRSLLRIYETIWILVITLECNNITASKSILRERKMRPMELSGVKFSTQGSE